jgi:Zn-dependent protease with chaperone function
VTYLGLGASLALSAFLAIDVLASVVAALLWRAAQGDLERVSPHVRAGGLLLLRVFPATAAAIIVLGVVLPAFWRFEPRETSEMVGESLVVLALAASGVIAMALCRGWRASRATARVVHGWLRHARPVAFPGVHIRAYSIDAEFPVVSVVGILRPRLFISERVLRECTPEELHAMTRHECGHLASRDNLKRLVLRACPTPLLLTRVACELERYWHEACEEAADDYAARASVPSALALANALLRVARMAPAGRATILPALSLYDGGSFERRIRRLIAAGPRDGSRPAWLLAARGLALVAPILALAVLLDGNLLHAVHQVIEAVVETLP